jgi:murein L,D-transpeptidase YcbB/YkuD
MRGSCLIPVLLCAVQALTFAAIRSACAQEETPPPASQATPVQSKLQTPEAPSLSAPQPVLAVIRAKLGDPDVRKEADADDLAALEAFYKDRTGAPIWTTDMGFSTKGQQALFEIEKASDWGLDKDAFDLPAAGDLPSGPGAQATAEIKLDLAILKYARFARGGRSDPTNLGGKVFQTPPLREPKTVLAEIASSDAPDAYLRSLQPRHAQFARLRAALLAARDGDDAGKPTTDTKRIILNMERWRWMPEDLGRVYVWSNTPAFMLYVVKDGETIYADKTQVGTIGYATPVLSADMTTVVFNPEWIAPPTVLRQNLAPALRKKNYMILKKSGFSVSRDGAPVDPTKVDWGKVNIMDYTFTQRPGPHSNVGKVKFLLPNKYAFVLHDTWPERYKYYQQSMRAVGHDCVRMEKPDDFAKVILAEGNGWPADKVEDLWKNAVNDRVTLDTEIPVYSTYFTAVADASGKVTTYPDLYGLDHRLAKALFGDADGFPMPAPEVKRRSGTKAVRWKPPGGDVTRALQGFVGD